MAGKDDGGSARERARKRRHLTSVPDDGEAPVETPVLFMGKRGPRTTPPPDENGNRPFRAPRPRNPCPAELHGNDDRSPAQPYLGVPCMHCGRCRAWRNDPTMGACAKRAIYGGPVCLTHGGSVAAVREAAQRRLLEAAATVALPGMISLAKGSLDEAVRLRAQTALMDRGGLGPRQTIEHEAPSFEGFLSAVVRGDGATDRASRYARRTADIEDEDEDD